MRYGWKACGACPQCEGHQIQVLGLVERTLCGMQGTAVQEGEGVLHNMDVSAEARPKAGISEEAASSVQDR